MKNLIPSFKNMLERYDIKAKKSLGQNFLVDANLVRNIIRLAGDLRNINIIEVGPGPGSLTRELITTDAASITGIELDTRCLPLQNELATYSKGRLKVVEGDALKIDVEDLVPAPRSIIANLPYNVATPLLIKWLYLIYKNPTILDSMTLMFQKEVAKRICAEPNSKAYGRISVISQWLCDIEYGFDVPPQSFVPAPKIMSGVLHFRPLTKPRYFANIKSLEAVVSAAFGQRRKMLRASLKTLCDSPIDLLNRANIAQTRRAETLSVEEFCRLANCYEEGCRVAYS